MEEEIKKSVMLVAADIEANCIEHGVRGVLRHDDIMKMIANYSEEDKQARIYGRFQHLTGLVFKMFNRRIHLVKPFRLDPREFCTLERLDTHTRTNDACLWVAFNRKGTYFVVDELWTKGTTDDLAYRIRQKADQYRVIDRRIDPSAFITDQHRTSQLSLAQELDKHGLMYNPASKERAMAIRRIQDLLAYQQVGDQMIIPPQLYIFETCERTIWEIEHWQYHEYKGKTAEVRNQSNKPMDKDDHMIENLGRAVIDPIGFIEMPRYHYDTSSIQSTMPTFDPYG